MKRSLCLLSFASILLMVIGFSSCGKQEPFPSKGPLELESDHRVGGSPLELNDASYRNAAGNDFKVSRLEYIISDPFFISERGKRVELDSVLYIDQQGEGSIVLKGIPSGTYLRAGFTFGLSPADNESKAYHDRKALADMAWPEQMGGGYHFMRFEGHYKDSSNSWVGFALHIGKDGNHIEVSKKVSFRVKRKHEKLRIRMELKEWFKGDGGLYDLQSDPTYSMSNDQAMERLKRNGISAFEIKKASE